MSLKAAIVDDEPLSRARLRRLLEKVAGTSIAVVAECVDVVELLGAARDTAIDVLFLDIEMPGGDGFSALAQWRGPAPLVVFVTAYHEHGARAFDARAVDYLLKPLSAERLQQTVERLRERLTLQGLQGAATDDGVRRIPLQVGQRVQLVPESQINVVEAQGNYLDIDCQQGRYTLRRTLASFEAELDTTAFLRVHRSTIVRTGAIREIMPMGSGRYRLDLHTGRRLVSGRNYRDQIHGLIRRGIPTPG